MTPKISRNFFELNHAEKYQSNGRVKIAELWVPAAMLLESAANDEQSNEFVIKQGIDCLKAKV